MCLCMHVRLCDERRFSVIFGLCVTVCIHLCVCFFLCVFTVYVFAWKELLRMGETWYLACSRDDRLLLGSQLTLTSSLFTERSTLWGKSSSSEASSFGSSCHGLSLKLIFVAHVLFWVANFRRANWMFNDHVVDIWSGYCGPVASPDRGVG